MPARAQEVRIVRLKEGNVTYLRTAAVGLLMFVAGVRAVSAADAVAWHTDFATAVADAEARDLPLLVYLTSSHCAYCVKMKAQTLAHPSVVAAVGEKYAALTVARGTAPELERRLNVRAYPTTVVLEADQTELGRITGFVAPQQLTAALARLEAQHVASKQAATAVK